MKIINRYRFLIPEDGGGGDGGTGGGDGGDGGDKGLSDAAKKEISGMIGGAFKALVSRGSMADAIKSQIEAANAPIMEKLNALGETPPPKVKEGDDDPKVKKLESEMSTLKAQLKAKDVETTAAAEKLLRDGEKSALEKALRDNGVDEARLGGAAALLIHSDKRIKRDDNGNVSMTFQRDGYVDLEPVDKGVIEWLDTDTGKAYLPATGAGGSGNTGGKRPKPGDKKQTAQEALTAIGEMMLGKG